LNGKDFLTINREMKLYSDYSKRGQEISGLKYFHFEWRINKFDCSGRSEGPLFRAHLWSFNGINTFSHLHTCARQSKECCHGNYLPLSHIDILVSEFHNTIVKAAMIATQELGPFFVSISIYILYLGALLLPLVSPVWKSRWLANEFSIWGHWVALIQRAHKHAPHSFRAKLFWQQLRAVNTEETPAALQKDDKKSPLPGYQTQSELCAPAPWNKLIPVAVPASNKIMKKKIETKRTTASSRLEGHHTTHTRISLNPRLSISQDLQSARPAQCNFRSSRPFAAWPCPLQSDSDSVDSVTLNLNLNRNLRRNLMP